MAANNIEISLDEYTMTTFSDSFFCLGEPKNMPAFVIKQRGRRIQVFRRLRIVAAELRREPEQLLVLMVAVALLVGGTLLYLRALRDGLAARGGAADELLLPPGRYWSEPRKRSTSPS